MSMTNFGFAEDAPMSKWRYCSTCKTRTKWKKVDGIGYRRCLFHDKRHESTKLASKQT